MTFTVLFWNFNSQARDREAIVARVVNEHRADLVVLVEATTNAEDLLAELCRDDPAFRQKPPSITQFQVFTRFPEDELVSYSVDRRLEVWRLRRTGLDVLLGAIHFHGPNRTDPHTRLSRISNQRKTILDAEEAAGHRRTVLFGDLNMDPFDPAMIDPIVGVGSLPSRTLTRLRSKESRPRFYNPIAARLGKEPSEGSQGYPDGPPGTHYFPNAEEPFNLFWRHYDQVLVRPDLFDAFRDEDFRILTHVPGPDGSPRELVRCTGTHWKMVDCDHLPILFTLRTIAEATHG